MGKFKKIRSVSEEVICEKYKKLNIFIRKKKQNKTNLFHWEIEISVACAKYH